MRTSATYQPSTQVRWTLTMLSACLCLKAGLPSPRPLRVYTYNVHVRVYIWSTHTMPIIDTNKLNFFVTYHVIPPPPPPPPRSSSYTHLTWRQPSAGRETWARRPPTLLCLLSCTRQMERATACTSLWSPSETPTPSYRTPGCLLGTWGKNWGRMASQMGRYSLICMHEQLERCSVDG